MKRIANSMRSAIAAVALVMALPAWAQEEAPAEAPEPEKPAKVDISFNARAEYSAEFPKAGDSSRGFHGSFFNLIIKGDLGHGLSYGFRQRLNKFKDLGNDVFSATDWLYLNYAFDKHWSISGGKQILLIGGYEYDAPPIDIYYSSTFWQNIRCYQFGVSGTYTTSDGRHSLTAQISNSPFYATLSNACFAYNLFWSGRVGCWHTLWSFNLLEQERGTFAQYIALGNRFDLGRVNLELDLMNRHYAGTPFLRNWSLIAKADYRFSPMLNVFVKGGYEHFNDIVLTSVTETVTDAAGDPLKDAEGNVVTQTAPFVMKKPFASAGAEIRPIKKYPGVRLHAVYGLTTYEGEYQHNMMLGVTWDCHLYKRK